MHYYVLTQLDCTPSYRGVYRYPPYYREDLDEDSVYNQAFLRLAGQNNQRFASIDEAQQVATELESGRGFVDIIGVDPSNAPVHESTIIGYDVASDEHDSFLAEAIRWTPKQKATATVGPMLDLIERYFSPRLNQYGLFPDYELARLFCDVLESMQTFVPDIWESPGTYHPEVLAIHGFRLAKADER